MIYGISGKPVPANLPYADVINSACETVNFPPLLAYAVAWNETIGEYGDTAASHLQDGYTVDPGYDGTCGHGLFQLTSSGPVNWQDPTVNTTYALTHPGFLVSALEYWHDKGLFGNDLVRATAASFNAGIGGAEEGHDKYGNVDHNTTDNYGARALQHYLNLLNTGRP